MAMAAAAAASAEEFMTGFVWDESATPGASWSFVATALGAYAGGILVLKLLMIWIKRPVPLGPLQALHNLVLLLASAAMLVGSTRSTLAELQEGSSKGTSSLEQLLCLPPGTRPAGKIFFWSYAYFLSKIYELLDTGIIILRKRRLTLFHLVQHGGNLIACFAWLHFAESMQLAFLLINAAVQTLLYSYFLATTLGLDFSTLVKKLVTLAQISQFAASVAASAGLFYWMNATGAKCSGDVACAANAGFNLVLMLLLVNYYVKVFVKKSPPGKSKSKRKSSSSKKIE